MAATSKRFFWTILTALLWPVLGSAAVHQHPNVVPPLAEFGSYGDGPAEMNTPSGAAISNSGKIFVSDTYNHRIKVIDSKGRVKTTYGPRIGAWTLVFPKAITADADGSLVIWNVGSRTLLELDPKGRPVRQHRIVGVDGIGYEVAIATTQDRIVVSDVENSRLIFVDRLGRKPPRVVKLPEKVSGLPLELNGIAIAGKTIHGADTAGNRIVALSIDGRVIRSSGEFGSAAGLVASPSGIAYRDGRLYVVDQVNHRLQVFDERDYGFVYQWGRHPPTAHEGGGRVHYPEAIAVSPDAQTAVVCEPVESRCQLFSLPKITANAAKQINDDAWWNKEGRFHYGKQVKSAGNLLVVTEQDTHAALFFDMSKGSPRLISKLGGYGSAPGQFIMPSDVLIEPDSGRVSITDRGNNRVQTFRVNSASIDGEQAFSVELERTYALPVRFKSLEKLEQYSLQKIDPGALIKLDDGRRFLIDVAQRALLEIDDDYSVKRVVSRFTSGAGANPPKLVRATVDLNSKRIYATDPWNFLVRVYDFEGKEVLTWGSPGPGPAQFLSPFGVTVDGAGNVYVSDTGRHTVKKFSPDGKLILEFGGYGVDDGKFYKPKGLAFDAARQQIIVNDFANHRAQVFDLNGIFKYKFGIGEEYVPAANRLSRSRPLYGTATIAIAGLPAAGGKLRSSIKSVDESLNLEVSDIPTKISTSAITLVVTPKDSSGSLVAADAVIVDAMMPAHQHGLEEAPTVTKQPNGSFRIEGLRFQMRGSWKLNLDVMKDGVTRRVTSDVVVD